MSETFSENVPRLYLNSAEHELHFGDALSQVSPLAAHAELSWAAADFEIAAGALLFDKLTALGYSEEDLEDIFLNCAEHKGKGSQLEFLLQMTPDEMTVIYDSVQEMGDNAQIALARRIAATTREFRINEI